MVAVAADHHALGAWTPVGVQRQLSARAAALSAILSLARGRLARFDRRSANGAGSAGRGRG